MSATSIAAKLLITSGTSLWFSPVEWIWLLGPLPPGVRATAEFAASTVAVMFVSNPAAVRWFLDRHRTVLTVPPVVWLCYPARGRPDLNRRSIVTIVAAHGLQPVSEVPVDGNWAALRLRPIAARPAVGPT